MLLLVGLALALGVAWLVLIVAHKAGELGKKGLWFENVEIVEG